MSSKTDPRAFRTRTAQLPGDEERALQFVTDEAPVDPRDAEIASLRAQLALRPATNSPATAGYEYESEKGKQAREASAFAHLTVAELVAAIDRGEALEPATGVLCKDGYYCRRS